ncbi:MAG: PAS domain S-box protein [Desulfobacula sp.]|nr:PAS domain S-box protein [Desulfobacula sp.]
MGIPVWQFDLNYRVIKYNEKARQIYGDKILGQYCYFVAAKRHSVCTDCPARLVYEGQESGRSQHERIDASGERIYIDHMAAPIRDVNGNMTGVLVLIINITARKQLEEDLMRHRDRLEEIVRKRTEALKKEEEKYRRLYEKSQRNEALYISLLNSSADAVAIYDLEGNLQYINQAFTETFGWTIEELKNKRIPYVPEQEKKSTIAEIIRVIETGIPSKNFPTKRYTKDGRLLYIYISASRYDDHEGNPAGLLVILKDVTHIKATELQVQQAQKMESLGTLAGGIAHDFNNILSGIFGFSQLARNHLKNPEKAEKDINQIIKGAQKATDLVQQILTVSRQSTHEKHPVSICSVIEEALKLLRATIPATIEIKEEIYSKATVMADPTKLHQVIMNLCTNAYHAMCETGGSLFVGLKEIVLPKEGSNCELNLMPGKYLDLEISDTGHGIDSTILKRIFDPYFTTKEPGKGTGLGLAVVLGIVEELNGQISVHSEPGQGSTFHIYLPITDDPEIIHTLLKEKKVFLYGNETIMFVDDEESLREVANEILKGFGYTVQTFSSGTTAFEAYKKNPYRFDLILTDMTMPGMTGLELSQKILELRPEQPVVLCTGYSDLISKENAFSIGISDYFEKPIVTRELAKIIRRTLDKTKGNTQQ